MFFLRIDPNDNEDFREVRTIEEAIKYGLEHHKPITEENMIQYAKADLKKYNIDISRDDYDKQNGEVFRKLDYIFVSEDGKLINESWFVEKYLIGQERLEKKYGCYMMGLDRKLTKKELEWDSLYAELDTKYLRSDAERNITRKDKPGLLMRIKDTFGFELDDFPNEQQSWLKLIYLLYCFERDYKVEFTSYFNNPTLENVNDIIINSSTKNGYLLEYLRRSIVRELNKEYTSFVNPACCKMIEDWEVQLQKLMLKLDTLVTRDTGAELKRSCELVLELTEQIDYIAEHGRYKHNLLETVYLKLWQHEILGREYDILEVTQKTQEFIASLPDDLTEYRRIAGKTIYKKDLKQFIKDYRKLLARLVFESETVTSNQYKKFDLASEKVEFYLDMLNDNTMVNKFVDIPQLLVVAAIKEIINIDKKEVYPNHFYRYSTSEQRTMNSELVYATNAYRKSQIAWVARVNTRYNAYNGRKDEALLVYKAQSAIDKIIVNLFKTNSITDMLVVHNFYMQLMDEVLLSEELYKKNIDRFEKSVGKRKKGYHIANAYDFQARRFFAVTVNSGIVDQLAKRAAKNILKAERTGNPINFWHPIELKGNYYEGDDNYKVGFRVDPRYKEIYVLIFENDMDAYRKQIMKDNGITIL